MFFFPPTRPTGAGAPLRLPNFGVKGEGKKKITADLRGWWVGKDIKGVEGSGASSLFNSLDA